MRHRRRTFTSKEECLEFCATLLDEEIAYTCSPVADGFVIAWVAP